MRKFSGVPGIIFVVIPEIPLGASFRFHPISWSKQPDIYRYEDLRSVGQAQTEWMVFFEEILVGLYYKRPKPVPFVFRTANGTVRSLDAGCVKWLLNREPAEISLHLDHERYITAITPTSALLARYEARKDELVRRLEGR